MLVNTKQVTIPITLSKEIDKVSKEEIGIGRADIDYHINWYLENCNSEADLPTEISILKNIVNRYENKEDVLKQEDVELIICTLQINIDKSQKVSRQTLENVMVENIIKSLGLEDFIYRSYYFFSLYRS